MTVLRWKAVIILGLTLACLLGLLAFQKQPDGEFTLSFPTSLAAFESNLRQRINLGLDLRGGMHLILQVQVEEALRTETDQVAQRLTTTLREQAITFTEIRPVEVDRIAIRGIPVEQTDAFRNFINENYRGSYELSPVPGESSAYHLTMTPSYAEGIRRDALRSSIETIRQRIDALGVTEPTIAEHGRGEYEILVQLPGVDDPARVKNIIQSTAMLELKLVLDGPFSSEAAALASRGGILPPDAVLRRSVERAREGWYMVTRSSVVTGRDLRTARAEVDPERPGFYQVSFFLSRDGAARFGPFTEQNINNPMAVVLDSKIYSVAEIQSRIDDAGRITGQFSLQTASDLALVLRSGALPASLRYLEERTVGPSLGADSIRQGFTAAIAGLLVVVLTMLFYYRGAGINATVALVLNLIILLAALAYFGATLTLPGIAGIALTIGMAVDANVLVFERVREELRMGKGVVAAVETGFDRAFTTIFDTNATTIIAAVFLFLFGTGPVRGFAVTLTVGLIANVFTAVYVSRAIFEWVLSRRVRPTRLSIG
ncbi:MAG: protein translocase subunit SecD [Acidobacteria bacterium]|nr:protein translocase subunit SecD [Acidobacteriota bacterium]